MIQNAWSPLRIISVPPHRILLYTLARWGPAFTSRLTASALPLGLGGHLTWSLMELGLQPPSFCLFSVCHFLVLFLPSFGLNIFMVILYIFYWLLTRTVVLKWMLCDLFMAYISNFSVCCQVLLHHCTSSVRTQESTLLPLPNPRLCCSWCFLSALDINFSMHYYLCFKQFFFKERQYERRFFYIYCVVPTSHTLHPRAELHFLLVPLAFCSKDSCNISVSAELLLMNVSAFEYLKTSLFHLCFWKLFSPVAVCGPRRRGLPCPLARALSAEKCAVALTFAFFSVWGLFCFFPNAF